MQWITKCWPAGVAALGDRRHLERGAGAARAHRGATLPAATLRGATRTRRGPVPPAPAPAAHRPSAGGLWQGGCQTYVVSANIFTSELAVSQLSWSFALRCSLRKTLSLYTYFEYGWKRLQCRA